MVFYRQASVFGGHLIARNETTCPSSHVQTTDIAETSMKLSGAFPWDVDSPVLESNSIKFCLEAALWELGFLHGCLRQLNESLSIEEGINASNQVLCIGGSMHNCGVSTEQRHKEIFVSFDR